MNSRKRRIEKVVSKNTRRESAKRLAQQIVVTTNHEQLADLTRVQNKQSRLGKANRVLHETGTAPSNKKSSILTRVKGSGVDDLTDGERVLYRLLIELEKRTTKHPRDFTDDELRAVLDELFGSLSSEERAAFEALNVEKVI